MDEGALREPQEWGDEPGPDPAQPWPVGHSEPTDPSPIDDLAPTTTQDGSAATTPRLSLAQASAAVVAAAEALAAAAARDRAFEATEADLVDALQGADTSVRAAQAAMVGIVREAITRGLPQDSGHSLFDWIGMHAPLSSRADRAGIRAVATALQHAEPGTREAHLLVEPEIESGELGIVAGRRLFTTLARIRPHVDDETYARDLGILLPLAVDGTEQELRTATDRLLELALPEQDPEAHSRARFESRGVTENSIASAQLEAEVYELRITCDREGELMFRSLFASPLAKPCPNRETGERDPRTAAQRRYDTLTTMLGRGLSAPAGTPGTAKATVLVTMTMDQFTGEDERAGHGGTAAGPTSGTGQRLSPGEARRAACDAGIIPVVLGGPSQVLDVGRASRLATGAQRHALRLRDWGCTYPGCTVPAGWCDAHHLIPWSHGGATDLDNLALLCQAHHTVVHQTKPSWTFAPPRGTPEPWSHPEAGPPATADSSPAPGSSADARPRIDPAAPPQPRAGAPLRIRWLT